MYELVYFLTIVYSVYVIDKVLGEQIISFIKNTYPLDLSEIHTKLRNLQAGIKNIFGFKLQPIV